MTIWIILVVAAFITLLSIRQYSFGWTATAMLSWIGVWAYYQSNPPAGIVANTTVYDIFYYVFLLMAVATFFIYFRNRNRTPSGYQRTAREQARYDNELKSLSQRQMTSEQSYRQTVNRALRSSRYRNRSK